jgi:putative chitinase
MNLEQQFLSMGMSAEDAKKNAENFVTGLKELGLSDAETPQAIQIAQKNNTLANILIKAGVRPNLAETYSNYLDRTMIESSIQTKNQKSMFLAQVLHESAMLSDVTENLSYSELNLAKVFKKYFDRNTAKIYARNPEKIANRVYANRMGNGNEMSGDGWKYKGRGLIQLTGKENYFNCGKNLGIDLIKNPDYLTTPEGAARSAGWFWRRNKLNFSADKGDIITNTKIINGGSIGLDHRTNLYQKLLNYF